MKRIPRLRRWIILKVQMLAAAYSRLLTTVLLTLQAAFQVQNVLVLAGCVRKAFRKV